MLPGRVPAIVQSWLVAVMLVVGFNASLSAQQIKLGGSLVGQLRTFQLQVRAGRIFASAGDEEGRRTTNITASVNGHKERMQIAFSEQGPHISYTLTSREWQLTYEIATRDTILLTSERRYGGIVQHLRFSQVPGEPLEFAYQAGDIDILLRADSLWALFLMDPVVCRQNLPILLEVLRPDWRLATTATDVEALLISTAARSNVAQDAGCQNLVNQLASDSFQKREAAERALAKLGDEARAFLMALNTNRLDAEQQYRIRRLLKRPDALGEEQAAGIVGWLARDPAVWEALLSRNEASTRATAKTQLERRLGAAIDFDPAADAATRTAQLVEVHRLVEKAKRKRPN